METTTEIQDLVLYINKDCDRISWLDLEHCYIQQFHGYDVFYTLLFDNLEEFLFAKIVLIDFILEEPDFYQEENKIFHRVFTKEQDELFLYEGKIYTIDVNTWPKYISSIVIDSNRSSIRELPKGEYGEVFIRGTLPASVQPSSIIRELTISSGCVNHIPEGEYGKIIFYGEKDWLSISDYATIESIEYK